MMIIHNFPKFLLVLVTVLGCANQLVFPLVFHSQPQSLIHLSSLISLDPVSAFVYNAPVKPTTGAELFIFFISLDPVSVCSCKVMCISKRGFAKEKGGQRQGGKRT
jgi:hypothetical protein